MKDLHLSPSSLGMLQPLTRVDSVNSVALDFHVDMPPKPDSLNETQETARVAFNKIVSGRYINGSSRYVEVGALLIYWEDSDMAVDTEVDDLKRVLELEFGFYVEVYKIPSQNSASNLYRTMSEWASRYDGPHKLSLVYYGGHGSPANGQHQELSVHATRDQKDQAEIFFAQAVAPFSVADTDTLLVVDCCFAARAFANKRIGKRKFEVLCAVAPSENAFAPKYAGSFTKLLCTSLEDLLKENREGFTTSQLYMKLFHKCPPKKKPMLFDQSSKNYGWIYLRPTGASTPSSPIMTDENIAVELRLLMSKLPTEPEMTELAAHMQYLPLVKKLEFQHLHAPENRLNEFLDDLMARQRIRPYLKKLRQIAARKRNEKRGIAASEGSAWDKSPQDLYNWGESEGVFPGKPVRRVSFPVGIPRRPTNPDNCVVEENNRPVTHTIGNFLSFRFSLTGLTPYLSSARLRYARFSPIKRILVVFVRIYIFLLAAQMRWANCVYEWLQQRPK